LGKSLELKPSVMASFAIDLHAVLMKSLDQNYGGALTSIMVTEFQICMHVQVYVFFTKK
jgi:hypothetical protein